MIQEVGDGVSDIYVYQLENGLRCVHRRTSGAVSYIGLAVNAGSRDEPVDCDGLAHFVEHTIFKGTHNRSSWHISNRMESVGGELNAYTSKEETVVYTAAPAGDPGRALELLADLVMNSCFPAAEIEREREVVCEEIKSYLDSPCDSVYDEFEELIYNGSRMAHNILGSEESVRRLTGTECRGFIDRFYIPGNMALYIADPSSHRTVERLSRKYFEGMRLGSVSAHKAVPAMSPQFDVVRERGGFQAHTIVGARTFSRSDERRFPLFLLNNYLGGPCMNSLLNQELRERRGYVYTVDSTVSLMSDCGIMQIYFGSDRSHVSRCRRLIMRQIEKLAEKPIPSTKFDHIKRQYIGQLLLSTDHCESMAMSLGKSILYYNEIHDVASMARKMRDVTAEQVRNVARQLLETGFSSLTLC